MNQNSKDKTWVDETGMNIPYNRTTSVERLMERKSAMLMARALAVNQQLSEFKKQLQEICDEVYEKFMVSKGGTDPKAKGNFTWFNFDRSIKIEVSINERILFDDLTIKVAQERLNEFLAIAVDSKFAYVKDLINDAFATSRGKMDAKKVLSLLRYRDRINHPLFTEATKLIEQAVRRPDQKTYFRIWLKDDEGAYQAVELNFSNI